MRSVPTEYAGVRFRSRLEARWAAFFDLSGWIWKYEPVRLKGWVPDFLLNGMLVEVKPINWAEPEICFNEITCREDLQKVRAHPAALILGAYPHPFIAGCIGGFWPPDLAFLTTANTIDVQASAAAPQEFIDQRWALAREAA